LLKLLGDARWQMNLSVPLFLEYEDVIKRPDAGLSLSIEELDDILDKPDGVLLSSERLKKGTFT